jgi:methionyl-tRNA formyltransferase
MDISVVIPVFNEEVCLIPLCKRLTAVLNSLPPPEKRYEIIFVDDGSTDRSYAVLKKLAKENSRVNVIQLSRNFGQHPAILAGLEKARGEIVVTLDADLQNPPEEIPKLLKKLDEGYDVVSGWRSKRRDSLLRKMISGILSRFTSSLVGAFGKTPLHDYGSMLRAYRRPVVDRVLQYGGRSFFLPTLVASFGERIVEVEVEHHERMGGVSKYGIIGMSRLYFDLISGQTLYPFQLFSLLGLILILFGAGTGIYMILRHFLMESSPQGIFFPFSAFFLVFFGILLVAIGVVGEYLGRIYKEVGKKPPYFIQEEVRNDDTRKDSQNRIAFLGYGELGHAALQGLLEKGEKISVVVTHLDDPKEKVWFRSVRALAFKNLIPVYAPEDINRPEFIQILKELNPDLVLSVQFRQVLSREILNLPSLGSVNLHPSLLPKYRGRAPINWAIINGEKNTGVTLHYMDEKPDTGDIIAQKEVLIRDDDTVYTLYQRILPEAVNLIKSNLDKIKSGDAPRYPQSEENATHFGKRKPEDGKIAWKKPNDEIRNLVRGVTHPFPGAFTFWNGKKIFVWKARRVKQEKEVKWEPGTVLGIYDVGILVACGRGALLVERAGLDEGIEARGKLLADQVGIRSGAKFT